MKQVFGAQTVETIAGKRIIKSGANGATNVEEIKWLIKTLIAFSAPWKNSGWVYMIDITKMAPASPEVSKELVNLHGALLGAGCKGMAFVEGSAFVLAAQAKNHGQQAKTGIREGHFKTEAEAIAWIDTFIK